MTNKERYRIHCQANKDLPVFVRDWYLDAVCVDGDWDVALVSEGGKVIASLPYFVKRKWGFRYVTMPHFVKMMGPNIDPGHRRLKQEHRLLENLISQLPELDGFQQNFHYNTTNWLPFYWADYQQTTRYTYIVDVSDLHQVYKDINRNMRRNIKKAAQQLTIRTDLEPEEFYRLNKMSFDRQGMAIPYSYTLFKRHDEALASRHARQLFFAADGQGRIHSAAYLIWDGHSAYYHLSGDDPALRQSGAGILLIWEAIKFTGETLGLSTFDFEGSMLQPVEQIRRQFGALQKPYHCIWKYHSRLYRLFDKLKNL